MGQFSIKSIIAIDSAHTVPQRALDCRPGLGELNHVYGPNHPTPSSTCIMHLEESKGCRKLSTNTECHPPPP